MDSVRLGDIVIHCRFRPAADGAPTVVFINSLGTDFRIWDAVVNALDPDFGVLVYDKRGHGLSSVGETPYVMDDHSGDLAGLMDARGISRAIICGLSVGGPIAQQLYFDRPDLVAGILFCDTAAKIGDAESWNQRIEAIRRGGLAAMTDGIMERWFSKAFRDADGPDHAIARAMFERQPVDGYLATCAALAGFDRRADIGKIAVPVSVVVGSEDGSTPPALVEAFAREIPGSEFQIIDGAGHLPCIEAPKAVAGAIVALAARIGA